MKNHKCNWPAAQARGNWKCNHCTEIFRTRNELTEHKKKCHPEYVGKNRKAWNSGLTKDTNESLLHASNTVKANYESGKTIPAFLNKQHSKKSRKKISKSMTNFFKNNPEKVYFKQFHSSNFNYAEDYFKQILETNNIQFEHNYHVLTYFLDFAIIDKKIDIEIDGAHHRKDKKTIEHDKIRNSVLINNGWKVIRIYWPEWKKLNDADKYMHITRLLEMISSDIIQNLTILI